MGLPRFIRAPGKPYRELITDARYSDSYNTTIDDIYYELQSASGTTPVTVASRPFTISKPGWVLIVATTSYIIYAGTSATSYYYIDLYRDGKLLDTHVYMTTQTGWLPIMKAVLYGWEYLTPGDYTVYIKAWTDNSVNKIHVLTGAYRSGYFPKCYPYLISVNQITLK